MASRKEMLTCSVCGDSADSLHFGALSCRACAAFFRRAIAYKREFPRQCEQMCRIDVDQRKLCASCRFRKCQEAGMNETSVVSKAVKVEKHPKTHLPILEKLLVGYANLEERRKEVFKVDKNKTPIRSNYKLMNDVIYTDLQLVVANIVTVYEELLYMSEEQKKILTSHFLLPFVLLECRFRAKGHDTIAFLANGDYIDHSQIEEYYKSSEGKDDEKSKLAYAIFNPYWKLNHQILQADIRELQLDRAEFLYLCALIFWDFGIHNHNEESIEMCQKMRNTIIEELTKYEKSLETNTDHSYRIATIMITMQSLQRCLNLMEESREVSKIYNLYEHHSAFFESLSILK